MNGAFVAVLHGGYWSLYLLLVAVILAVAGLQTGKIAFALPSAFPLLVLCVAPNLISFYSFYFLLFTRFLTRRKFFAIFGFGLLVSVFAALTGAFLSLVFFGFGQTIFEDPSEFLSITIVFTLIAAIHGAIALVIRGFIRWFEELRLKEDLARKNFETEIALVKSQLNPHFLFNTINNIDVLIAKDAARASEYLNKLSDILRYTVYETKSENIPLAREIEYIEKYLELQKIRAANPDYVRMEINGRAGDLTVAPMIFFPFIENAFKHTENNKRANSIRIKFSIFDRKIIFECENSYQINGSEKQDFGGLGNELVKKRLALVYGAKHGLEIADAQGIYRIKLTLTENLSSRSE